jgi:hypothetical protein
LLAGDSGLYWEQASRMGEKKKCPACGTFLPCRLGYAALTCGIE